MINPPNLILHTKKIPTYTHDQTINYEQLSKDRNSYNHFDTYREMRVFLWEVLIVLGVVLLIVRILWARWR